MATTETKCDFPDCSNAPALKICSKCKKTRYCSPACQKNHWSSHKLTCVTPEERKLGEEKLQGALALIALPEAKTLLQKHYEVIVRSTDSESPMRAFTKQLFPILQQTQDWSSVAALETLFVGDTLGFFEEALEKFRSRNNPSGLPLPVSPLGMAHLVQHNTNASQLLQVLTTCIEKLGKGNLSSQWTVEFFHRGMAHQVVVLLPEKSTAIQQKICQIFDILFSQAHEFDTDVEVGVFIMQAIEEFQDKLGDLCRMDIDDMRRHQNARLSAFRNFLELKLPVGRWVPIVLRFKLLALQALNADDHKKFRKLVLVSELVRQALELGLAKLFATLETIGFRLFLEMVERTVTAHEVLHRLMYAARLGPFR